MEFVILCQGTPEAVRAYIESRPDAQIQERDDDWRVSYGFGPEVYLDFMYQADFNSASSWAEYLQGLKGFVTEHVVSESRKAEVLESLDEQRCGLTVLAEPDIVDWTDNRLAAIHEYAVNLGTFLHSPDGLFDLEFDPLASAGPANDASFIKPMIQNCCLYFPTAEIPFKKVLPGVTSDGGVFKAPTWYEFESEDGRVRLNTSQPDMDNHLQGFKGYVAQLPSSGPARARAQGMIDTVRCVVGVELPKPVARDGRTFGTLVGLLREFDGFMFVSDSIMLPDGTFVVGPMAQDDEQQEIPAEEYPVDVDPDDYRHEGPTDDVDPARVAMREKHYCMLAERGFHCARWMPLYRTENRSDDLRPIREIAARAMALKALFFWASAPDEAAPDELLHSFTDRNQLKEALTESEREILGLPREQARQEHAGTIGWKLENMWALSWILGFEPAPIFYQGQLPAEVSQAMVLDFLPDFDGSLDDFAATAKLQTAQAVAEMEDLFYCAHNAVRSAQTGSTNAVPRDFHPVAAGGAVHERRHSLTWAVSPGVAWDETDLST